MLFKFLLFCLLGQLFLVPFLSTKSDISKARIEEKNRYKEAGRLTYEHFSKAYSDSEMKRFLIANFQDPKEFEGLSRITICEKMKYKAELTGEAYTRFP